MTAVEEGRKLQNFFHFGIPIFSINIYIPSSILPGAKNIQYEMALRVHFFVICQLLRPFFNEEFSEKSKLTVIQIYTAENTNKNEMSFATAAEALDACATEVVGNKHGFF